MTRKNLFLASLVLLALGLHAGGAGAQTTANLAIKVCSSVSGVQVCNYVPVDSTNPLPVIAGTNLPVATSPPMLTAYGTLAVTNTSVALSTLTVGPNSPTWTTTYPSKYVSIRNSILSAGVVYFCPLGGTCSASVGEPIAVGETIFRSVANTTAITLIAATTATVTAEE